jgi:hypothetical protein
MQRKEAKMLRKQKRTIVDALIVVCFAICLNVAHDSQAAEKEKTTVFLNSALVEKDNNPFSLSLSTSIAYGQISGFTQAGLGGRLGTGSPKKPKIKDDLGVDDGITANFSIELGWKRHSLYTAAHLINLEGENTVDRPFIFHGRAYTAGMRIESEVKSNWYEIGYRFRWPLDQIHTSSTRQSYQETSSRSVFTFTPTVTVAFWDYSVQLQESGVKNERSPSGLHYSPRLGALLEWYPWPRFSIIGKAIGSLPIDEIVHIYTLGLTANYNLIQGNKFKLILNMGVGYDHVDFKDEQTFPNKIRIDIGPMVIGGLKMQF